jgi:phage protein U
MPGWTLFTWGAIPFETYPLNVHETNHITETDWARKEIVGAAIHHEWVGENEEEIRFHGRVFPHFFSIKSRGILNGEGQAFNNQGGRSDRPYINPTQGGLGHLDVMDNMRKLAQVHALVRGDGWHLGWFGIQRLTRNSTNIERDGVGQQIEFEVLFTRFPIPSDPSAYFPNFWGQVG